MAIRPQPHRLKWPLTPTQVEATDEMFQILFKAVRGLEQDVNAVTAVESLTYANRPDPPVEGMLVSISDSSTAVWGATIAGAGANRVLAYYNGTNWTVAGK